MNNKNLEEFSKQADDYLLSGNLNGLKKFVESYADKDHDFDSSTGEAQFYYALGNCYSALFHPSHSKWYAAESSKVVICYRKALSMLSESTLDANSVQLKSMISTNLGNHLSSQGRAFCCIEFFDEAIRLNNNPVAYVSKARNELFIAESLYDVGHKQYHYYTAAKLIQELEPFTHKLESEQRIPIEKGGMLYDFKKWFHSSFKLKDFDHFKNFKEDFESAEQQSFLQWCGDHNLFLNDLNDVCQNEIVYQDVLGLSSFGMAINPILIESEKLAYHSNYDEIKNDYCYARYLMFQASTIEDNEKHYFNNTYQHVDGNCGNLDNLKVGHLKSAFKTLYSIFDKIAYFTHRFFDLNDISKDNQIYIDKLFKKLSGNGWKPNEKLENGQNFFINALFFILQDLRDVKGFDSVSKWVDPSAKKFTEIRNAMEHRSLIVVDAEMYDLSVNYNSYAKMKLDDLEKKMLETQHELQLLGQSISAARKKKDSEKLSVLLEQRSALELQLKKDEHKLYEKQKLSTHTLHVSVDELEKRLFTLIKLVRASIMYLSLAINLDSTIKQSSEKGVSIPMNIPLKK
ncbi:LA2681 family HEPN domain-containing protein [Vibrio sp. 1CM23M]|uniref:LA2681 family HEPN domain-containing protein n=1 Tax=Vibrio sp. 1CM23M TaxID=2929164 RepID=UPI0020BF4B0A|nr:LA2681 family HEPN domain-containing protein [Vibrio sp. 1CM23M]MCK8072472.1 LA2681 family HEPN domain-containing protein [Vibrio sp. 1CM23M]